MVPELARVALRGVGQVFFQECSISGALFLAGIAASSPTMAIGAVCGALIGLGTALALKFDRAETMAGIYGFNSTLVGIATRFFFKPGLASIALLIVGGIVATIATRLVRRQVPFPTYTTPFIVTTWVIYFLGPVLGAVRFDSATEESIRTSLAMLSTEAVAHGIGQVMFQASLWTGLLFLAGIAVSDWRHALLVLSGSVVGMLVASYHATAESGALHIERLFQLTHGANIALGLYGYNATLVAVALFLWRRSLVPILLGTILSVPLTELVPLLGLPALTAPFVLAAWLVMACDWLNSKLLPARGEADR
jgi:urea transporter